MFFLRFNETLLKTTSNPDSNIELTTDIATLSEPETKLQNPSRHLAEAFLMETKA